jgi:hypothetical protein
MGVRCKEAKAESLPAPRIQILADDGTFDAGNCRRGLMVWVGIRRSELVPPHCHTV